MFFAIPKHIWDSQCSSSMVLSETLSHEKKLTEFGHIKGVVLTVHLIHIDKAFYPADYT